MSFIVNEQPRDVVGMQDSDGDLHIIAVSGNVFVLTAQGDIMQSTQSPADILTAASADGNTPIRRGDKITYTFP